ncbi:hypothetical protein [Winogradskyella helgolandensis]|uniref:hypothetical protein n=1 Tax=Winogradskyella helgolandensis TaxID=2697010 RepID=UPI0015C09E75|nr:hypothetical protein [Winogradskyella helgolandensis]
MKIRLLKLSAFVLLFIAFMGCKDDCSECKKENEILKEKLDAIPQQENSKDTQSLAELITLKKFDVEGYFSVKQDNLLVIIPTTDSNLKYKEAYNISTNGTNAVLIRIDSDSSDVCSPKAPVVNFITESFSLVNEPLKLEKSELENDEKIMVIVINNDGTDIASLINNYKSLISKYGYNIDQCLLNLGCTKDEAINMRPNEDGGDILTGG